jgi:hypothetical protein
MKVSGEDYVVRKNAFPYPGIKDGAINAKLY